MHSLLKSGWNYFGGYPMPFLRQHIALSTALGWHLRILVGCICRCYEETCQIETWFMLLNGYGIKLDVFDTLLDLLNEF